MAIFGDYDFRPTRGPDIPDWVKPYDGDDEVDDEDNDEGYGSDGG
jgi:hypothetical protein